MKDLAFLEYTFLFEPSINTWSRGRDFEDDLAIFFAEHGLQATVMKTVGATGRRIICVERDDKLDKMRQAEDLPQKGLKNSLAAVMKKASNASIDRKGSK